MADRKQELEPTLKQPRSVVVLTGAGISAESGLPTFRGAGGVWENHRVEDVATPTAFERDPELVHRFYNLRRRQLLAPGIRPNPAHLALADFERRFDGEFLLITQNIDHLHEQAGSVNLLHMHGELLQKRCGFCGRVTRETGDIEVAQICEGCGTRGGLRPNVVWFGEMPMHMERIFEILGRCDLFVSIGTSGHVYPAAGFVDCVNQHRGRSVEMNLEPSLIRTRFDQRIYGPAGATLPPFLEDLLAGKAR